MAAKEVLGFQLGQVLGRGGFGFVKEATLNGNTYAMKIVEKGNAGWNAQEEKMVRDEIAIMTKLNHPNIIKVISSKMDGKYPREDGSEDDCVIIVMELARGGNLFDVLFFTDGFDETVTRTYLGQLISAVAAMHELGICHRDIKPQNTLLDSNFNVKICDFGLSKETDGASLMSTTLGTRPFQAPELIMRRDYDFGVDVFALGVCYFLMLTGGVPPFKEATVNDKWFKCIAGKAEEKFWKRHKAAKKKIQALCGDGFQTAVSLFFWMCAYQPTERATITDCHGHEWFSGPKTEGEALKSTMKGIVDIALEKKKEDPELGGEVSKRVRAMCLANYDMEARAPEINRFVPNFTYEIVEDHPYLVFMNIETYLDDNGIDKDDIQFNDETFEMDFEAVFANNHLAKIKISAYREGEQDYIAFRKDVEGGDVTGPNMLILKVIDKICNQLGGLKEQSEDFDKPINTEMVDDVLKHMEQFNTGN